MILALASFAVGLLLPPGVWLLRLRHWGLPVEIRLDPDDPTPAHFAQCLAELARRLDERPERMRLALYGAAKGGNVVTLDLAADGSALLLSAGNHRNKRLDLRRRWIAEHPVPLVIAPGRKTVLYITPVDANRFRVASSAGLKVPLGAWVLVSALTVAGICLLYGPLLAAAGGLALGCAGVALLAKTVR